MQLQITARSGARARRIAQMAVERGLVTGVHAFGPTARVYRPGAEVDETREWLCLLETRSDLLPELRELVRSEVSDRVREMLALRIVARARTGSGAADEPEPADDGHRLRQERWQLLSRLDALLEGPMLLLAFVWLALLVLELSAGLPPALDALTVGIWTIFALDFLIELLIAPDRRRYLRRNWLTALSLLLPALRIFRLVGLFRLLRLARIARSANLLRLVTSLNRGMAALARTLGRRHFAYVTALTLLVVMAGAAGMAYFESPNALREAGLVAGGGGRAGLSSYGDALWWTAMLMTTIGSDYWPVTPEGRVLAWLLGIYALGVFGYVTATIASVFILGDTRATALGPSMPDER